MPPTKLDASSQIPRPGMFAIVRNRRGVVAAVEPSDDARHGRLHLVHLEYKDDQLPVEERLLWELEPHGRLLEPNALPSASGDPMPIEDFDALVRAARWTSASPFIDPDGQGPTGTESGKTECFLSPIISKCLELRDANAPAGISAPSSSIR